MKPNAIFNNLHFRTKIIWIFGITFFFSMVISGWEYYQYTSYDIQESFLLGAEDVLAQTVDILDTRLGMIRQRSYAMLSNYALAGMSDYLNNPSDGNKVKTMGDVSSLLKDLEMGDNLIHSSYIYTDQYEFENFTRIRNWNFRFKESEYYKTYQEETGTSVRWLPSRQDEIFQGGDEVIPYIRKFRVLGHAGDLYLIIQLGKTELEQLIGGKYEYFDQIIILDSKGNTILGPDGVNVNLEDQYEGESYLVSSGRVMENGWQVFGLKSREILLRSLKELRSMILQLTGIVFFVGVVAISFLSRQMTNSLQRLEKRMSCVQRGDFDARFFYPYKDEVGSLAKSFNYMVGEIQRLLEKQEEAIQELKQERDHVGEVQKQIRKAELKALQAQINPHFLYNTLNAITWQAADQGAEEISVLSSSLGRFFRVSLSRGAEIITLKEELEHVTSYLDIQSIRYHSRLNYEIEVSDEWLDCRVIKLILQPLVENSIYHGIKEKRGGGQIRIRAERLCNAGKQLLELTVGDDGAGITADKLAAMNRALKEGKTTQSEGYGIYNVNERLRLFYGEEYGLHYESEEGLWTKAVIVLPFCECEVE